MTLEQVAERLAELLVGKTVTRVFRHRGTELAIEFADGTRFFVDRGQGEGIEVSVTGGAAAAEQR